MPDRLGSDGSTIIVFVPASSDGSIPDPMNPGMVHLAYLPGTGLRVKEFGKAPVDLKEFLSIVSIGGVTILGGSVDPSEDDGVAATAPAIYVQDDGTLWLKTGSEDDDWTEAGSGSGATSPLTTKGDLWGFSTLDARLGVGADGKVLTADSAEALGVKWDDAAVDSQVSDIFEVRLKTDLEGASGTLTLLPYKGNHVWVKDELVTIADAGITRAVGDNLITNAGADAGAAPVANTDYYAYLSNSQAAFSPSSIRLSLTPPTVVPGTGVEYLGTTLDKLNWRFIGYVTTNGTPQFESSLTKRLIVNRYHQEELAMYEAPGYVDNNAGNSYALSSTTWKELDFYVGSGGARLTFRSDGRNAFRYDAKFQLEIAGGSSAHVAVGEDTVINPLLASVFVAPTDLGLSVGRSKKFTEGVHYVAMLGAKGAGAPIFIADNARSQGGSVDVAMTYISGMVKG